MLIAAFCLFAPAAFSLGLRRWLLGRESTGEALLHFGTAALWLNALALAVLPPIVLLLMGHPGERTPRGRCATPDRPKSCPYRRPAGPPPRSSKR